jgi:hypothetical protein
MWSSPVSVVPHGMSSLTSIHWCHGRGNPPTAHPITAAFRHLPLHSPASMYTRGKPHIKSTLYCRQLKDNCKKTTTIDDIVIKSWWFSIFFPKNPLVLNNIVAWSIDYLSVFLTRVAHCKRCRGLLIFTLFDGTLKKHGPTNSRGSHMSDQIKESKNNTLKSQSRLSPLPQLRPALVAALWPRLAGAGSSPAPGPGRSSWAALGRS